jgi:hypothetical protein
MSDNNLHCEKMQAAELERLTGDPAANSESAECNSSAYYQTLRKPPRTWTCTATFYRARVAQALPPVRDLGRVWHRGVGSRSALLRGAGVEVPSPAQKCAFAADVCNF